jgi:transposase
MMGHHSGNQDRLFYSFNLDEHVPADHLLRGIDRFLDLADLRQHLAPFYSHTGRPSVDPELMVRMLLVGYCFGIRSERRLCEEVHLNLAYRWFCRLGLEDKVPDHSSFSKNRHGRFRESDLFRHVFEGVVRRCMAEGLVRGEGFAIDASVVKADANRQRGVPSTESIDWNNAVLGTRAVHEYLQALEQDGQVGVAPMNISLTDPAARWTAAPGGPAFYAYSTNYLIDVHAGVIVDVEATAAHRTEETDATKTMLDRVEERFDLKPQRLIGDTALDRRRCSAGWWRRSRSSRTSRCGTRLSAQTTHCPAAPSTGMNSATNTAAHRAMRCGANGDPSRARVHTLPKPTRSFTHRADPIARRAR